MTLSSDDADILHAKAHPIEGSMRLRFKAFIFDQEAIEVSQAGFTALTTSSQTSLLLPRQHLLLQELLGFFDDAMQIADFAG